MTNFEYILKNLSERDIANIVLDNASSGFSLKIFMAFENWRENLAGVKGNMYYINDPEHQPNVFATSVLHFYEGVRPKDKQSHKNKAIGSAKDCKEYNKYSMPRTDILSMEIWLTKQYNPKEWEN